MNKKILSLTAAGLATMTAAAGIGSAAAHHSFAMFDADKTVTMQGTVTQFEWVNPHSWLRFTANDEKTGRPARWAIELSSPSRLITMGMRARFGEARRFGFGDVSSDEGRFAWRPIYPSNAPEREASDPRQCGRREPEPVML